MYVYMYIILYYIVYIFVWFKCKQMSSDFVVLNDA